MFKILKILSLKNFKFWISNFIIVNFKFFKNFHNFIILFHLKIFPEFLHFSTLTWSRHETCTSLAFLCSSHSSCALGCRKIPERSRRTSKCWTRLCRCFWAQAFLSVARLAAFWITSFLDRLKNAVWSAGVRKWNWKVVAVQRNRRLTIFLISWMHWKNANFYTVCHSCQLMEWRRTKFGFSANKIPMAW